MTSQASSSSTAITSICLLAYRRPRHTVSTATLRRNAERPRFAGKRSPVRIVSTISASVAPRSSARSIACGWRTMRNRSRITKRRPLLKRSLRATLTTRHPSRKRDYGDECYGFRFAQPTLWALPGYAASRRPGNEFQSAQPVLRFILPCAAGEGDHPKDGGGGCRARLFIELTRGRFHITSPPRPLHHARRQACAGCASLPATHRPPPFRGRLLKSPYAVPLPPLGPQGGGSCAKA
jgi:hypothetical protein